MNETFTLAKANLVVGNIVELNSDKNITFKVMNVSPDRVNLLLDGEVIDEDLALANVTGIAKRLVNSDYSDSTNFHTPREWNHNGIRLTNLVEGNLKAGEIGISRPQGSKVQTVNVTGNLCEGCFTTLPLTGICDFC